MSRGAFVVGSKGGHGIPDTARCPACREPARLHNAAGSVRADSDCTEPHGGANVPASAFPAAVVPTAARTAPADGPAAVETPRRTDPRPAVPAALAVPAVVGGGDAVEEVAADPLMTGPTATALDQLGAFLAELPVVRAVGPVRRRLPGLRDPDAAHLPGHRPKGAVVIDKMFVPAWEAPQPASPPVAPKSGILLVLADLTAAVESREAHLAKLEEYTSRVEREHEEALRQLGLLRTRIEELETPKDDPVTYLLWSGRHDAWWAPDERGYVASIERAGRYNRADAVRCVVQSAQCGIREQVTSMVAAPDNWTVTP